MQLVRKLEEFSQHVESHIRDSEKSCALGNKGECGWEYPGKWVDPAGRDFSCFQNETEDAQVYHLKIQGSRSPGYGPVCFSVVDINTLTTRNLGKETVYSSSHFFFGKSLGKTLNRNWSRDRGGTLLTVLLPGSRSAAFLVQLRPLRLGMAPPTVAWAVLTSISNHR